MMLFNVGVALEPVASWEEDEANPPHFTNASVRKYFC